MSELSFEWSKFIPSKGYEKAMQDIKLFDGTIITYCWPNAGFWNVCHKQESGIDYKDPIPCEKAEYVRLTNDKVWN